MTRKNSDWFNVGQVPAPGSRGAFGADFDNDGDEDLFICNNGAATRLYENTGNGFVDVTSMMLNVIGVEHRTFGEIKSLFR